MKLKHSTLLVFLFLGIGDLFSQTETITLLFHSMYSNFPMLLENSYKLNASDSIKIESLKFYISEIELSDNEKMIWEEKNSFHLIDAANEQSLSVFLQIPQEVYFTKIKFNLGIDSITNVSGAMGGDLDPTRGMYWTWQSGYINFKLEGKCNLCRTRNNEFQFHLGGYQYPYNSLQAVILNTEKKEIINIDIDIQKIISGINFSELNHIMSPGKEAVEFSRNATKLFSVRP
jgi:hypothetical protein